MFTFDQLRSFVVLAEELHFSRAADKLNMTQPPLSRQIQKLEAELGFTLFDRNNKSVQLTAAGSAFRSEAEKILSIAEASRAMAQRIADGSAGEIKIGITATGIMELLGEILARLDVHAPGVAVDIAEMVTKDQIAALLRGSVDIAFVREVPLSAELDSLLVRQEPLVAAISNRHRLAVTSRELSVTELEGEHVLTYSPVDAHYFRALVDSVLSDVATRPSQQITQVHSMLSLVAANKGIALVPFSASKLGMPGVVFRGIREHKEAKVRLHAVWRADNSNPVMGAAARVLQELHSAIPAEPIMS
ncbi:LysR family transcriptional regulator [Cryobacterium sp. BB307]|uniref:LysR family transcriptional regulator n=1 Tax=Cryobacterium sp. BB307 TaxID=2716317 RepID=UPI00144643B6|nr:LysR family transcriptional regulator [Cryobacterium sp. BB307]